ncbi:hypothetical protein HAHE_36320 [Haloferula helveola]|uniref:CHRD domain-containing protein n=1 Tax=Haloferula helveola TaxID=490095 RepID=A0ABM7RIE6_9BACT|nr:hypothetical protein HAHE_36320 [Haloferula helveola]
MKATTLIVTLIGLASLDCRADGWINFVRQNQIDTGVVWDMPVNPIGNAPSALTLEEGGALFQLWTIRQDTATDYLLDQKVVGTYLPSGAIRIETGDPYPKLHRTRADQPFTVHFDVDGLLSGPGVPDAATRVLVEHHLAPYIGAQTTVDPRVATGGTPASSGFVSTNGTTTLNFAASSLPATDPTKALGEEHFVIHALADGSIPQTQLASNFVQIWPVADGAIQGISNGDVVRMKAPNLSLVLKDLYPSSTTYLQVYEGSPALGTEGTVIEGSALVIDQDTSLDRTLVIRDWGDAVQKDGTYTLELVTITPFGTERLSFVQFTVNRELAVNALMGDIETGSGRIPTGTAR